MVDSFDSITITNIIIIVIEMFVCVTYLSFIFWFCNRWIGKRMSYGAYATKIHMYVYLVCLWYTFRWLDRIIMVQRIHDTKTIWNVAWSIRRQALPYFYACNNHNHNHSLLPHYTWFHIESRKKKWEIIMYWVVCALRRQIRTHILYEIKECIVQFTTSQFTNEWILNTFPCEEKRSIITSHTRKSKR